MNVYRDLTREEIEAQYFLRGTRPNYETTDIPRWLELSRQFVGSTNGKLDLVYGPRARNKLDFFLAAGRPMGFMLYIHGGYWQRGDKSVYSFVARPFIERGISVALMNYQMCPDVRLSEIAPQVRQAVAWLWRHADELSIPQGNFNISGHSAGGHLTVETLFTDWTKEGSDLPRDLIHAGIPVSGIYDFEPILHCSENEGLRLDKEEARLVSPMHRTLATRAPQLIAYGLNEPPDMHRQSEEYVARFRGMSDHMHCLPVSGVDHFETVDVLADDKSELFDRAIELMLA